MNKDLKKKLLSYSAVTGAALMVLPACKKDGSQTVSNASSISKNNLSPAVNAVDSCTIDFDGDGNIDLSIQVVNYVYNAYGYSYDYGYSQAYGRNGAEVLTQPGSITVGGYTYNYQALRKLAKGNEIGPNSATFYYYGLMGIKGDVGGYNVNAGAFISSEGYVGVKFMAAGNTHYGWAKVSVSADGKSATISEAAFETVPNTAIEAGDK